MSKHVRPDLLKPAGASCRFAKEVTNHRRHLFANEDPEKPQKRDDRGRRGANLNQAAPVLTSVQLQGGFVRVAGSLIGRHARGGPQ